ncbi:MAG: hypothetical protein JWN71_1178 [Xanthobacteraceae bacterium]|jgi:hypothetical protein|nr:hypothetical protein [Xanthobacteraceae bacterium]
MLQRIAVVLVGICGILPAQAEEMKPTEARSFVVGKLFAFNCFEGTQGSGRIYSDGSVAGTVQFQGKGPQRYVRLPSGTLKVKGEAVCASVRGLFFEPCFNLNKTSQETFRGSLSGMGFAYCEFTKRSSRREMMASNTPAQTAEGDAPAEPRAGKPRSLRPPLAARTEPPKPELRPSLDASSSAMASSSRPD